GWGRGSLPSLTPAPEEVERGSPGPAPSPAFLSREVGGPWAGGGNCRPGMTPSLRPPLHIP
ncbi:hypothetical protein P7K49_004798, partial [Saguinus oedipus]